jgi:hypothetical protein
MTTRQETQRDERTVAVENASYKWAYTFITFALLIDAMCRAALRDEAAWDLFALLVAGGAICLVYQARHKTLAKGWVKAGLLLGFLAGVIGFAVALVYAMTQAL